MATDMEMIGSFPELIEIDDKGKYRYGKATDMQKQYMVEVFGPEKSEQERARLYNNAAQELAAMATQWEKDNAHLRPRFVQGSKGEDDLAWEPKASYTARTGFSGEDYDKYIRQSLKTNKQWLGSSSQRSWRAQKGKTRFAGAEVGEEIRPSLFVDEPSVPATLEFGGGRGSEWRGSPSSDDSIVEYGPSIASMARSARKDRIRRGRLLPAADVETPVGEYGPSIASMATAARMYGPSQ